MRNLIVRAATPIAFLLLAGAPSAQAPPSGAATRPQVTLPKDIDPQSRARLPGVKREELDEDGQATYDFVVNPKSFHAKSLPTPIGMWMHSPKMAAHILPAYMYLRFDNSLGTRLAEVAILTTAREIASQYQWTSHEPQAESYGISPQVVDVIKYRKSVAGLDEKDGLVITFGRELLTDRKVTSETFARALKAFGKVGVADLGAVMAFYEFLYLSSNATFDLQMSGKPLLPEGLTYVRGNPPAAVRSDAQLPADIDRVSRARLPGVKREDLDAEGKATYDFVVNPTTPHGSGLPTPIGMWMQSPKMAAHILRAYIYLRFWNPFGVRHTELAILLAAREANLQFQWTSHEPTARKVGLEPEVIDVVRYRKPVDGLKPKDAVIIKFAREMFRDRRVSSETFAEALRRFGRQGVTDLAGLMAFYEFLYLSSNVTFDLQMPADWKPLLPMP